MHTPTNNLFDMPPPINPLLTRGTAQVSHRNRDPIINPAHRTTVPAFASAASVPTIVRPRSTSRGRSSSRGRAVSRSRGLSSRSSSRGSSRGNTRRARSRSTSRSRSINNRVSSHTLKIPSPEIQ